MKKYLNEKIVTSTPDWDLTFLLLINLTNKAVGTVIYDAFYDLNVTEGKPVQLA